MAPWPAGGGRATGKHPEPGPPPSILFPGLRRYSGPLRFPAGPAPEKAVGSSDLQSCGVSRVAPLSVSACRLHLPRWTARWWLDRLEPGGLPRVRGGSASTTVSRGVLRVLAWRTADPHRARNDKK